MSQLELEDVAESIPHLVWLADASGAIDYLNDRVTEFVGGPREASYGWRWVALLHPDDVERTKAGWVHATTTLTPFEMSYRLRRADGEFRWHDGRALPVRREDGEVLRWLGTADDVSSLPAGLDDDARIARQTRELRAMFHRTSERERPLPTVDPSDVPGDVAPAPDAAVAKLTPRDLAVARLIGRGHTNAEISGLLGFSIRTIEANRAQLRRVLGLQSRADIVRFALEHDLDAGL